MISIVYQFLLKFFSVLFTINIIYMLILSFKLNFNGHQANNSQETAPRITNKYGYIMLLISGVSFACASMFLILVWKQVWFLMVFCALYYLRLIHQGLSCAMTVSSIIKDTASRKLTFSEKNALTILASLFFLCNPTKLLDTFTSWGSKYFNSYSLDFCTCLIYLVVFFFILFGSVSFFQTPLSLLATGYMRLVTRIPVGFKQKYLRAIQDKDLHVRTKFWCVSFVAFAKKRTKLWRLLLLLCVPLVVSADFLVTLLAYCREVVREILVSILRVLHQLVKLLNKLFDGIINCSDRRIVAMSFRVATVASIASIVIINRIDPIFVHTEESTAILEFIASAVVIPVIYSWISTWLEKRKQVKT